MKKKKKGFTLVELIAVIVILAFLALIGIPAYNSIRSRTLQKQYDNLVILIETTSEKYASANGVSLINVEELINEGLLETDDGKYIYDPRDKKILNCYLIEVTYDKGKYNAEFLEEASFASEDDNVCDLNTARAFSGDINIVIKDLATGRTDYAYNEWINATSGVELSVDRTNMAATEVIDKYKWLGGNGQSGNEEKIIVKTSSSLNTVFNLEVVTLNKLKYYAKTVVKLDVAAPVIEDVEVSGGNNWANGRTIKVKASDKGGSGIVGYYTGEKSCLTESVLFVSSNQNKHTFNLNSADIFSNGDDKTYYVCVKDAVGNVTQYDKEIKLNIKDKTAPNCVWEGESTDWTNNDRTITLKCQDDMSGCDPQYSEFSNTYTTTKMTDTLTYTIKDKAGNKTVCTKNVNVYVDTDNPSPPTTMDFVYGNWNRYTQSTWSYQNVYAANSVSGYAPSGSTDSSSGISHYQISTDNSTWHDYNYSSSNNLYRMNTEGTHTRYFRAVDRAGNVSSSISRTAKLDLCVGKTGSTGSWSSCSASCGSGTQTRTTTYTGISGRSCGSTSESQNCFLKSCAPTVTITGNIDRWACNPNKCRTDNYTGACALNDAGNACIQTFDGKQGNVVAKVSYSKSSNTVTFTVTMRQGKMTWIGSNSTIQFNIRNGSGNIYTGSIKSSTDANWNYGSTHTKQFTYTFNTKGTYYIYITSNSVVTSFDNISLGTITIS